MIPKDADWLVRGYKGQKLLLETWHRGDSSKDAEIAAWKARMRRGEVSHVEVVNRNRPFDGVTTIYPEAPSETT